MGGVKFYNALKLQTDLMLMADEDEGEPAEPSPQEAAYARGIVSGARVRVRIDGVPYCYSDDHGSGVVQGTLPDGRSYVVLDEGALRGSRLYVRPHEILGVVDAPASAGPVDVDANGSPVPREARS